MARYGRERVVLRGAALKYGGVWTQEPPTMVRQNSTVREIRAVLATSTAPARRTATGTYLSPGFAPATR